MKVSWKVSPILLIVIWQLIWTADTNPTCALKENCLHDTEIHILKRLDARRISNWTMLIHYWYITPFNGIYCQIFSQNAVKHWYIHLLIPFLHLLFESKKWIEFHFVHPWHDLPKISKLATQFFARHITKKGHLGHPAQVLLSALFTKIHFSLTSDKLP